MTNFFGYFLRKNLCCDLTIFFSLQAMLSLKSLNLEDLQMLCQLENLTDLELGNCDLIEPEDLFSNLAQLPNLRYLRLEKGRFDLHIGQLAHLPHLRELELIEFEMVQGFREGLVNLQNIRKLLLIPTYKDEVRFRIFPSI